MKHVIHWLGLLMFIPAFLAAQEVEVKGSANLPVPAFMVL